MILEKAKITFNLEAQSHQDVSQTISAMAQSGVFTNIKSGQVTSVERDKKANFPSADYLQSSKRCYTSSLFKSANLIKICPGNPKVAVKKELP